MTDAQKRAKKKYNQKVYKVNLAFYPTEQPLIDKLKQQNNKSGYIKKLIKKDIERKDNDA